jgi:hypothetical protein
VPRQKTYDWQFLSSNQRSHAQAQHPRRKAPPGSIAVTHTRLAAAPIFREHAASPSAYPTACEEIGHKKLSPLFCRVIDGKGEIFAKCLTKKKNAL